MSADDEFKIWQSSQRPANGQLDRRGATLKVGPRVCKTVTICDYGDVDTGTISKREVRVETARRLSDNTFDWDTPERSWSCENDEIDKLITFLTENVAEPGTYRLVAKSSSAAAVTDLLEAGNIDAETLAAALVDRDEVGRLLRAIVSTGTGEMAAAAAVQAQRRGLVSALQELALAPGTTEIQMHRLIGNAYWLFGGRYVGVARRDLVQLDQHDIALMGVDGTLHIVELKGPCITRLVRRHRNHWIVGNDVHEAVSQAMNYVRSFDEQGAALETIYRNEFGEDWDMRRLHATVVIGHPDHVTVDGATARVVDQTIRSYNAHLSRVEVITYKSLLDAADQALRFTDTREPAVPVPPSAPSVDADADPWGSHDEPPW